MSGLKLGAGLAAAMLTGLVLGFSVSTLPALAQSEEGLEEGRKLVETNCGACYGVGKADASPHVDAPLFRKLSERFPMDALEEAFADGHIYSDHPDMPEFIATPEQVESIVAYIASLQG